MRKPNSENLLHKQEQSGNALIYVLIGIALIGFLTVTMSNQGEQADGETIDDELAELYALELIEYAQAAKSVVDQMEMTGTGFNDFDFINPTSTPYNTAPYIHKIFHPQGGGLTYKGNKYAPEFFDEADDRGWNIISNNVEWTPSSADDIILTFLDVNAVICANINKKISGSSTIPALTGSGLNAFFLEGGSLENFNAVRCPTCEGYPSFCLSNQTSDSFAFYNILLAR